MAWAARSIESLGLRVCEKLDKDFQPGSQITPAVKAAKKAVDGTTNPYELEAVEWLDDLLIALVARNQILHSDLAGWANADGEITHVTFRNTHREWSHDAAGKKVSVVTPIDTPVTADALEQVRADYEIIADRGAMVDVHLTFR